MAAVSNLLPAGLAADGHFGILGMRERMEQIWGSLEVTSSPGSGPSWPVCLSVRPTAPVRHRLTGLHVLHSSPNPDQGRLIHG